MATFPSRNYNCKNEELPVICKFAAFSLKRDLPDFQSYSPRFNEEYVGIFESRINEAGEIVEPKSETLQIKIITDKLYNFINGLKNPINRLTGYVNMIGEEMKIAPADFGLTALRKAVNSKDVEGVLKNLHLVLSNIDKYKDNLASQGLKEDLIALFSESSGSIAEAKQAQYEIERNRKTIVQNNASLFNTMNDQLTEILATGKILYKDNDPVKLQEYTFSELKKRVRKGTSSAPSGQEEPDSISETIPQA